MKFFTTEDNFLEIIRQHLPNVIPNSLELVKTGWTNFVICASDGQAEYFFRFPRNQFFARMMLKDHAFCSFARDKVRFEFPNLQIFYDDDRPFSMHRKIQGWSFSDRIKFLSRQAITNIAYDIARFIQDLNRIDPKKLPAVCHMPVSQFLDELPSVQFTNYDISQHDFLKQLEKVPQVVHGDLNPGNIILDENDRVVGIIDFAFAGISNSYVDLSRVICRYPEALERPMVDAYKEIVDSNVSLDSMKKINQMWSYVDNHYIQFMRAKHPEVQLPD
ncbi:MAG: phosphotransferase family protein [bacterium]